MMGKSITMQVLFVLLISASFYQNGFGYRTKAKGLYSFHQSSYFRLLAKSNEKIQVATDPYDLDLSVPVEPLIYSVLARHESIAPPVKKNGAPVEPYEYKFRQPKQIHVPKEVDFIVSDTDFSFDKAPEDERIFIHEAISKIQELRQRTSTLQRPSLTPEQKEKLRKDREQRKSLLPLSVQTMVTAIYHDKVLSRKGADHVDPTAYREYREWLSTTAEKMKEGSGTPLALAKNITAQMWLERHPEERSVFIDRIVQAVPVSMQVPLKEYILDEDTQEVKKPTIPGAPFKSTTKVMTASMLNWEKTKDELLTSVTSPSSYMTLSESQRNDNNNKLNNEKSNERVVFRVEDTEMFVANNCVDGYFVVL